MSSTSISATACLSPPFAVFCVRSRRRSTRREVGERQLDLDGLDVAARVDRAFDVDDVFVLEAADDLHDGVGLADVGEELVAEALALRRAAHESGDVHELE